MANRWNDTTRVRVDVAVRRRAACLHEIVRLDLTVRVADEESVLVAVTRPGEVGEPGVRPVDRPLLGKLAAHPKLELNTIEDAFEEGVEAPPPLTLKRCRVIFQAASTEDDPYVLAYFLHTRWPHQKRRRRRPM